MKSIGLIRMYADIKTFRDELEKQVVPPKLVTEVITHTLIKIWIY